MTPLWGLLTLGGDLKSTTLLSLPYENQELQAEGLWSADPAGQAVLDGRLKLRLDLDPRWRFEVHQAASLLNGSLSTLGNSGLAATGEELLPLSWSLRGAGELRARGRIDRLLLRGELGPLSLSLGRQPVGLGTGLVFTPLDLVSPFGPAAIDTEYRPGVDALRLDLFVGDRFEQNLITAALDESAFTGRGLHEFVLLSQSRVTVGTTDLALVLGEVRADEVIGLSVSGSRGAVGMHGDASLTFPAEEEDPPFVRAVAGLSLLPEPRSTLSAELYLQTLGTKDPGQMLALYTAPRWLRGELWAVGRGYASLAWGRELSALSQASLALVANVEDPSALLVPGFRLSVADEAELSAGAWLGLGRRPEGTTLRSEFGALPATIWARLGAWW